MVPAAAQTVCYPHTQKFLNTFPGTVLFCLPVNICGLLLKDVIFGEVQANTHIHIHLYLSQAVVWLKSCSLKGIFSQMLCHVWPLDNCVCVFARGAGIVAHMEWKNISYIEETEIFRTLTHAHKNIHIHQSNTQHTMYWSKQATGSPF